MKPKLEIRLENLNKRKYACCEICDKEKKQHNTLIKMCVIMVVVVIIGFNL